MARGVRHADNSPSARKRSPAAVLRSSPRATAPRRRNRRLPYPLRKPGDTKGWVTVLRDEILADHQCFSTEPRRIFFDTSAIKDMDDWRHRILDGLRHSRILLVCLSPDYFASDYCRWEFEGYIQRQVHKLMGFDSFAPVYFVEVPGVSEQEMARGWYELQGPWDRDTEPDTGIGENTGHRRRSVLVDHVATRLAEAGLRARAGRPGEKVRGTRFGRHAFPNARIGRDRLQRQVNPSVLGKTKWRERTQQAVFINRIEGGAHEAQSSRIPQTRDGGAKLDDPPPGLLRGKSRPFSRPIKPLTPPEPPPSLPALFPGRNLMPTFSAKASEVQRQWWIIDATDQVLGRVAAKAANLLRGKEKPIFTPHVDTGDFVIVINAEKVRVTGKKETDKSYMSFSGYVGGHKSETVKARRARRPELLVERAVKGMIPHNRLGRSVFTKLKVYKGDKHPHEAQNPKPVTNIQ